MAWHRSSQASRRLDDIPGVGPAPDRLRNVLELLLAHVANIQYELSLDLLISVVRKADRAGARQRFDTREGGCLSRQTRADRIYNAASAGWWLGTNIANRDKMRITEKACEVEKLIFGKDISITLPNAK
jgi:hypothetical protein